MTQCRLNRATLLALAFTVVLTHFGTTADAQDETVLDEIVAVVDGEIILRSDVNALVLGVMQQQQAPLTDELWLDALNELVNQKVILAHAKKDTTIQISPEQTSQEVDARIDRLTAQAGGQQRLEQTYNKTVAEIKAELTPAVREQLMTQEYQRRFMQTVKVTPSEVREWFNRIPQDSLPSLPEIIRVAHIVRLPEPDPEAREEALHIINTLRDSIVTGGATIEELAKFSDDPGSAENEGRYEGIRLSELVPEFGAIAASLEPGQVSHVFDTDYGLHIMRLNKRTGDMVDFNHILIKIDETRVNAQPAIELLTAIRDSVVNLNIPFERLARKHSEEERSANRGGYVSDPRSDDRDLVLSALSDSWQQTITRLEVDEVSEPAEFELLDGRTAWHIVWLQERIPPHSVSLKRDYDRIEQLVLQDKRALELDNWLRKLRKSVFVEMRVPGAENLTRAFE
jgi:peptidyl-prolyl cis-trans isomerase SurA